MFHKFNTGDIVVNHCNNVYRKILGIGDDKYIVSESTSNIEDVKSLNSIVDDGYDDFSDFEDSYVLLSNINTLVLTEEKAKNVIADYFKKDAKDIKIIYAK